MNKVEDFINATKLNDLLNKKEDLINMTKLNELLNKKEAEEKKSMLMEYLDLKTNEERLQFLQKRKADVTEAFLEAVAQSMDYTEKETSVELRLVDLMNYLRMLMKYERRM